jgi:hypothetical protein
MGDETRVYLVVRALASADIAARDLNRRFISESAVDGALRAHCEGRTAAFKVCLTSSEPMTGTATLSPSPHRRVALAPRTRCDRCSTSRLLRRPTLDREGVLLPLDCDTRPDSRGAIPQSRRRRGAVELLELSDVAFGHRWLGAVRRL